MLGIPAERPDDLSPSDVAKLIRCVRINPPKDINKYISETFAVS